MSTRKPEFALSVGKTYIQALRKGGVSAEDVKKIKPGLKKICTELVEMGVTEGDAMDAIGSELYNLIRELGMVISTAEGFHGASKSKVQIVTEEFVMNP